MRRDPPVDVKTLQAAALRISRGAVYYQPRPMSVFDEALMRTMGLAAMAPQEDAFAAFTAHHRHVGAS